MHVVVQTLVAGNFRANFDRFDLELFEALKPPLLPVKVDRFDGSHPGDEVHIVLDFPLLPQRWESVITEREITASEALFVDEGRKLPFPLASWRHVHLLRAVGQNTEIVDDITFTAKPKFLEPLMQLQIKAQMRARGPVYRRFFGEPT